MAQAERDHRVEESWKASAFAMSFVAQLPNADLLKKVVDAWKDLCKDSNFECSAGGIPVMSMDRSHVALVQVTVRESAFTDFKRDRPVSVGMNMDPECNEPSRFPQDSTPDRLGRGGLPV